MSTNGPSKCARLKIMLHTILNRTFPSATPSIVSLDGRVEGGEEFIEHVHKSQRTTLSIGTAGEILRKINTRTMMPSTTTTAKRDQEEIILSEFLRPTFHIICRLLLDENKIKAVILRKFYPSSERSFIRFLNVDRGSLRSSALPAG